VSSSTSGGSNQVAQAALDSEHGLLRYLTAEDEETNTTATADFQRRSAAWAQLLEDARTRARCFDAQTLKRAYFGDYLYRHQSVLARALASYQRSFDDFMKLDAEHLIAFFEGIPSIDVEAQLLVDIFRHWDRAVDPNDLTDISFLSIAIPYCDIVVTERFWTHLATRTGLDRKYDTVVIAGVEQLASYLASQGEELRE